MLKSLLLLSLLYLPTLLYGQSRIDSMLTIINRNLNDTIHAKTLVNLGIANERIDTKMAMRYFKKSIDLHEIGLQGLWVNTAFVRLAGIYSSMGNRDSATYFFNEASKYLQEHPNNKALSAYLTGWGIFNNNFGNYAEALLAYERNVELGEAVLGKENMAGNYLNMSNVYARLNQAPKREESIFKALAIFEELNNEMGLSFCYNSLGNIFYEQKDYSKAEQYYQKSLDIRIKRNDKRGMATTYNNLANIAMDTDRFARALELQQASLKINEEQQQREEIGKNYVNLGKIYQRMSRLPEALHYFDQGEKIFNNLGITRYDAFISAEKGRIYTEQANEDQSRKSLALQKLQQSIAQAQASGELISELNAITFLKEFYIQEKNYEEAFKQLIRQQALTDSLEGKEVKLRISQMETQYQVAQKENEIELLKAQQQLQETELERQQANQNNIIIALVSVLVISVLLINRYRVLNRTRRQLEIEKMRSDIARDLHDDLGSVLSSINIMSQMGIAQKNGQSENYLQRINEQSSRMMDTMSDIVWSIHPENDTVDKLLIKMKEFAAEILEPKGISYHFHEPSNPAAIHLNAGKRKNLFLIFKEAVNNAAKYSKGSNISIYLEQKDNTLTLAVNDNGKGFVETEIKHGNGLRNMEARARQVMGTLIRHSKPNEGTTVIVNLPIT
ncbi:MAG TPA: tetratricopeptide repeat protein [Cyclobacteriaceae bacterium]|nr:tetratricopeptide repeat protein [Cyclobacteriaceae bacterium]HRJ80893.1 tetratricopeptide repeat protein [Cyclobacteriaceae bacterium]